MSRKKTLGVLVFFSLLIGLSTFYWGYFPIESGFSAEEGVILIEFSTLPE